MATGNLRTIDLRPAADGFLADVLRGLGCKVKDHVIELAAGESIHGEISRQFRRSELAELAVSTGFLPLQCWTDEAFQFAIMLWSAKRSDAHQTADVNRLSTDKGGL